MKINLTETACRALMAEAAKTKKQIDLVDAGQPGLRLRASPGGTASWNLNCRDSEGRMRRFPLGNFPAIGIAEARKRARAMHDEVRQKAADPIKERRTQRAKAKDALAGVGTLQTLLDTYGKQKGEALKSWGDGKRQVENVFQPFLGRAVLGITRVEMQLHADAYPAKQAASAAVRYIRPILKWAADREMAAADAWNLKQPTPPKKRERVLSDDELKRVLPVLRASATQVAACMYFSLLTLARREEAASARWRDIDFETGVWAIPETKNGKPHYLPLSRQALAFVKARKPADAAPETLIFSTRTGGKLTNWHRETAAVHLESNTSGWHRHDLRRTGATVLGNMNVQPHVIEAALNHAVLHSALAGIYNLSRYNEPVAEALQLLADRLDGIEAGAAKVVPLRA